MDLPAGGHRWLGLGLQKNFRSASGVGMDVARSGGARDGSPDRAIPAGGGGSRGAAL